MCALSCSIHVGPGQGAVLAPGRCVIAIDEDEFRIVASDKLQSQYIYIYMMMIYANPCPGRILVLFYESCKIPGRLLTYPNVSDMFARLFPNMF